MKTLVKNLDRPVVAWFAVLHAVALVAPFYFFSWGAVAAGAALYVVCGLFGITLGYHRLLAHRSFKTPRWVERTLATCGVLAMQKSPLDWVAHHRMHHAGVDGDHDPHDARRGFWYSHIGWMILKESKEKDPRTMRKFARDIVADPYLDALSSLPLQIGMQVALAGLLFFAGGIDYVVFGIFVRLAVLYHATWLVNSAAHKWGYRSFDSPDRSRNCWWVALIIFGEGWHNNHHARQDVARAGLRWWEIDMTFAVLRVLERLGLAWDIRSPERKPEKSTYSAA